MHEHFHDLTAADRKRLDAAIALHGVDAMQEALQGWYQVNREMDFDWFITHIPQNIDRYRSHQRYLNTPQKPQTNGRQINPMTGDYTP